MSAVLESALDDERRADCAANDLAIEVSIYDQYSYARNSLMAAHFPEQLEAERQARIVPKGEAVKGWAERSAE